jgi:glutamate dehydrogenase (NADP+)
VLKFLAFEQTFKNALTTLPMGGGKGGSDFDPKGKSPAEVMRFCQAFVPSCSATWARHRRARRRHRRGRPRSRLHGRHVQEAVEQRRLRVHRQGPDLRRLADPPEATGYGTVYFADEMLKTRGQSFEGMTVSVSGSGNVAQYAVEKAMAWAPRS